MPETTIQISEQVCIRLGAFANERGISLSDAINKLLDGYSADVAEQSGTPYARPPIFGAKKLSDLIVYSPAGEENFKRALLQKKVAYVRLHYTDGRVVDKIWRAERFTEDSPVAGNLAGGYLRKWQEKGICKAEVSITPL